jgi:septal ring factor EnvC (AmiA/AmiB activator)
MAKKSKRNVDLVDRLRAGDLRKKVASSVADAIGSGGTRKQPPKAIRGVLSELRKLTDEIEDRATGRTRKRKAAARKAAVTRRKNAAKRSGAAKNAARTRAKKGR